MFIRRLSDHLFNPPGSDRGARERKREREIERDNEVERD